MKTGERGGSHHYSGQRDACFAMTSAGDRSRRSGWRETARARCTSTAGQKNGTYLSLSSVENSILVSVACPPRGLPLGVGASLLAISDAIASKLAPTIEQARS